MHLIALGLNHKTAAIGLREKLVFSSELVVETLSEIMHSAHINAAVLVSTCNRTEIYLEASSIRSVLRWLRRHGNLDLTDLREYTYLYLDIEAVRHLMQVASGLDSMVLGEVEILGQLKAAYKLAQRQGHLSKSLGRLFQHAFSVAKKARSQTAIGVNPVSVAYLAVRLAERIFAHISEQAVLIIGAGDTVKLLLKYCASAGVRTFYLANRTRQRSQSMLLELGLGVGVGVELIDLSMVPDYLPRADIVVTATSSPLPLVGKGMVEMAMRMRKHKPLFMIDLAVPRDIEPQVRDISDVYLYCIDDLHVIAAEHKRCRNTAAQQAQLIIDSEAEVFMSWLENQHAVSTIQAFRRSCEIERDRALIEALQQLQSGKDAKEVVKRLSWVLLNRLLHQPTVQLREAHRNGNDEFLSVIRKLYKIGV